MNLKRVRKISGGDAINGPVVYWMSRDQRVGDNWALLYAGKLAKEHRQSLLVVFTLRTHFAFATERMLDFMLSGLAEVEEQLKRKNIPFVLLLGDPVKNLIKFLNEHKAGALVTDFNPLRYKQSWNREVAKKLGIPFYEVDAHNIVPAWVVSQKQEYGAYTLRPKLYRLLPEFLEEVPQLEARSKKQAISNKQEDVSKQKTASRGIDWDKVRKAVKVVRNVRKLAWIKPGEKEARKVLTRFIHQKLGDYAQDRNNPNLDGQSGLSPYLHFGQLSAQRVALEVLKFSKKQISDVLDKHKNGSSGRASSVSAFLEELVVRRELADNFCLYNANYDSEQGFPAWARKTLQVHETDGREYLYSLKDLENAKTHDKLWNVAQMQMLLTGKMHGYLRMYWAKKILEWTKNAKSAMKIAVYLNDKYSLDGRDPSGYAGIAWSIGGVHDRAWFERKIFGLVRYMSLSGAKSKFDVDKYIRSAAGL